MVGIYVHIPFCVTRCTYCDFATAPYNLARSRQYHRALLREIGSFPPSFLPEEEVHTSADSIYIGGGTPSTMTSEQIAEIISELRSKFSVAEGAEITLEADPGTFDLEKGRGFLQAGVNRISLGAQSFDDAELRRVKRAHSSDETLEAFHMLRALGCRAINIDLIIGLPGQNRASWQRNVRTALELRPEHISLYMLELEPGTPLYRDHLAGRADLPDEEQVADWYCWSIDELGAAGYQHYEISNFALPGHASRHNLKYWSGTPYYGFGLSAHSFTGARRYWNESNLELYLHAVARQGHSVAGARQLSAEERLSERLFLGLRRRAGVDLEELGREFGVDLVKRVNERIVSMRDAGLVSLHGSRLELTRAGLLLSNEVFAELI